MPPFLKISAHFHLHDLPPGHTGLIGEDICFNKKGTSSLPNILIGVILEIAKFYQIGGLCTLEQLNHDLGITVYEINSIIEHIDKEHKNG